MNIPEILKYGVIGLGFLLSFLAYRLLSQEQKIEVPRKPILVSIYVFMTFAITLCMIGFFSKGPDTTNEITEEVITAKYEISQNLEEFGVVGMNAIRKYVDATYSNDFIVKVVSTYPDEFEFVCTTDYEDLLGLRLKQ